MSHHQFVSLKRLKEKNIIEVAARHNLREIAAEWRSPATKIDSRRSHLNQVIAGPCEAVEVARLAQRLMREAGIGSLRKDAVLGLEVLVSLPPEMDAELQDAVFSDAVKWTESHFNAPVLSAVTHRDEAAPHCHILVLPLVKGRMIGSELYGNKAKLRGMLADFHDKVGKRYGLMTKATMLDTYRFANRLALERTFAALQGHALSDAVLGVLLEPHLQNPAPLLAVLGLPVPVPYKAPSAFVKTMTRPMPKRV
ncbi:plasmid recombination protein [Massilia litorea]|uniref:Plasmid recombination protein n=1 Tax=Massilia litorea TaxID=2769491 RepID=A0A7L9U3T3_9BURK|nr:plasmid recombination protein [Massilia litorea]QOL49731.1 plasmid recombination protein [Massilia litorea]